MRQRGLELMSQSLTKAQQEAVECLEGPLLVLAGPGSGKTRVITHRIARLLQHGAEPGQILALTFTNKAAREMAERAERLLGGLRVRVSTFHRFCAGLLRHWGEGTGLRQNYTILDHSDQVAIVRSIMKDLGVDTVFHDHGRVLNRISRVRNDLISADAWCRQFEERPGDPLDAVVYHVFPRYERAVLAQNSVDFDDLLLHVVRMLEENPELRRQLDRRYRYVMVDEYQDTNFAQYRIVRAISRDYPNLCVTGDPDQSIYGWRGARADNISGFERDFPDVRIVSLDQNFRSTQCIVRCADQLIHHNHRPRRGPLTTRNPVGTPVRLCLFQDGDEEASRIAAEIAARVARGDRRFSDFAVFFRVNALSRPLEAAMTRHRVPYQVAAGLAFYERTEIRDLIAYLRLIENQQDDAALLRIINRPARGIGAKTVSLLAAHASSSSSSMLAAAGQAPQISGLTARSRRPLRRFVDLMARLHEMSAGGSVAPILERLIDEIDYFSIWREGSDEIDTDRQANIHELINAAQEFDRAGSEPGAEPPSLQGFLEGVCLTSEVDNIDQTQGAVALMTLHASKGLEFPVVFIVGLENGLIPHERAVRNGDPAGVDEERRLLYVGVTRAMEELSLTQTAERTFRGGRQTTISSPFVSEMDLTITATDDVQRRVPPAPAGERGQRLDQARRRFEAAQQQPQRSILMTGAALEERRAAGPDASPPSAEPVFCTGMTVRHPRYGRGTVTGVSSLSRRATVTVRFENLEHAETFVAGRCPLQPVGLPAAAQRPVSDAPRASEESPD